MSEDPWPTTPPIIVFDKPSPSQKPELEQHRGVLEGARGAEEKQRQYIKEKKSKGEINQQKYKKEME